MTSFSKAKKQTNLWNTINKEYKKGGTYNRANEWSMAPNRKGITKISGIKCDNSDTWSIDSKENVYDFNNKIKWYRDFDFNETLSFVGTFNLCKAKQEKYIGNEFPTKKRGTMLTVMDGNGNEKSIFIVEMSINSMSKCALPCANLTKFKNGEVQFCGLAVFKQAYVELLEGIIVNIRQDTTQKLSDIMVDAEMKKINSFHFGVGYCKVRDDDDHLHSVIALSPDYLKYTCLNIFGNGNINIAGVSIGIQRNSTNRILTLYDGNNINPTEMDQDTPDIFPPEILIRNPTLGNDEISSSFMLDSPVSYTQTFGSSNISVHTNNNSGRVRDVFKEMIDKIPESLLISHQKSILDYLQQFIQPKQLNDDHFDMFADLSTNNIPKQNQPGSIFGIFDKDLPPIIQEPPKKRQKISRFD